MWENILIFSVCHVCCSVGKLCSKFADYLCTLYGMEGTRIEGLRFWRRRMMRWGGGGGD